MEEKIKHLQMIEDVINRMADNSFKLKGWAVTIVSIIFSFALKEGDKKYMIITLLPLCVFWGLDAFYIQLERKYRQFYETVRKKDEKNIDFSMNYKEAIYNNDAEVKKVCYMRCLFSRTAWPIYGIVSAVVIILSYIS